MQPFQIDVVRMTLRVSRDSGWTWGPLQEVSVEEKATPPVNPDRYPPCACRRCQEQPSTESVRSVS